MTHESTPDTSMPVRSRSRLIVGNWKMYKTIDQALSFLDKIIPLAKDVDCKVWLSVPFTAIKPCADKAKDSKVVIGAQNMNDAAEGAFTGEVAASMLHDAGASFVIVGHSERRKIFSETNAFINRKVKRALASKLTPLLCIGETFEEHEGQHTKEVLKKQLVECLDGISKEEFDGKVVVAYEPVWAIGTGKAATPEIVEQVHLFCRSVFTEIFGKEAAEKVLLLYGGSVTPDNANGFLLQENVDGLLIGSCSLSSESFAKILKLRHNVIF